MPSKPFYALLLLALCSSGVSAAPRAFITNQLDNSVSVIDTQNQQVIQTIKVEGKPAGVALNNRLKQVYISTPEGGGFVVLDSQKLQAMRTVKVGGASLGITADRSGEHFCRRLVRE